MSENNDITKEVVDPHASKIDPNDPRLKIQRPKGRVLKKGPVLAISTVLLGVVMIAVTIALMPQPRKKALEDSGEVHASTIQAGVNIPDVISNAPDNGDPLPVTASTPANVPNLGAPLPGDLGGAMVSPSDQSGKPAPYQGQPAAYPRQLSAAQQAKIQERERALTSSLFFTGDDSYKTISDDTTQRTDNAVNRVLDTYQQYMQNAGGGGGSAAGLGPGSLFGPSDQNLQGRKNDFIQGEGQRDKNYVKAALTKPQSPYEVKAGSIIPISLITGINSDLPGEIIGQVRENVYDTVTGNYLLIPQGSRVLAAYDSMVAYGQDRALVCWNRLIRPDGTSINLECAPGVDLAGYAGFADEVDNHWLRLIGGVLVSSVLSATATTSQGSDIGGNNLQFEQVFAANAGQHINDVGQQITQKNLNIQPTIKVRPGFSVNVLVNKDMVLPPYKSQN